MTPYYADPLVTLHLGDCLEVMPALEAESVDAVVTDPPYGLGFMGKHWDHGVPDADFWAAMLRVTKPGGYLLAFGGTRTVHRIATNIEDAGWIIRDQLVWIYASGFPKGRANLKPAHEPIVLARKPGPLRPLAIDECRIAMPAGATLAVPSASGAVVGGHQGQAGYDRPWKHDPEAVGRRVERAKVAIEAANTMGRWPSNVLLSDPELFDQPNPAVVASGTVMASGEAHVLRRGASTDAGMGYGSSAAGDVLDATYGDSGGYSRFFIIPKADRAERERGLNEWPKGQVIASVHGGMGDAKNPNHPRANVHPTVKPIDLMRHLVRLVTPPGGIVLDPFLGAGSTALAASEEGFRCIGIEREPEYLEIAKGRLIATPMGMGLDVPAPTRMRDSVGMHSPVTRQNKPRPDAAFQWKGWTPDEEGAA